MASANVKNPQTFNRYSYVLNSPYKFTDPLGLLSVTTSACGQWCSNSYQGEGRYVGSNGNFSTEQHAEGPAPPPAPEQQTNQQQQTSISTQTVSLPTYALPSVAASGQIPSTVTVQQMTRIDRVDIDSVNGVESAIVGTYLIYTILDQDGKPMANTKVTESIKVLEGDKAIQNDSEVPLNSAGQGKDLVSNSVPMSEGTQKIVDRFNKDFVTRQEITLTITTSAGVEVKVTQERTLTNMAPGLKPLERFQTIRGYTFTMQKPTIQIVNLPNR